MFEGETPAAGIALANEGVAPSAGAAPPACVYCQGPVAEPLYEHVRDHLEVVPGEWSFWRCAECGSANLNPMPRAEELAAFYPEVYTFAPDVEHKSSARRLLAELEHAMLYRPIYRADARRVARNTGGACSGKCLLDVGCGHGLRLVALRELGYQVQGIDFQPEAIRYLNEKLGIPAKCADVGRLCDHYAPESFDVVTTFHVVEHLVDPRSLMRECFQLLRPGGWFVAAVPLVDGFQAHLFKGRWYQVTEAPRHVTLPTVEGMVRAGRACGFDKQFMRPDATRTCASIIATTLFPAATTHFTYGHSSFLRTSARIVGTLLAGAAVPWCWAENHLLRRPACGVVFMRKPTPDRPNP